MNSHNTHSRQQTTSLNGAVAATLLAGILVSQSQAAPPTELRAVPGNGIVSLVWKRPDLLKTETYNIYRSTTSGNTGTTPFVSNAKTVTVPTCLSGQPYNDNLTFLADFGDTTVTNGTTYYYQVTMMRAGVESAKTTQVSATPVAASHSIAKSRFLKIMPMGNSITGGWCGDNGAGTKGGYRGPLYDTLTKAGYNFLFVGSCMDLSEGKPYQYHEGWGSRTVQDILRTVVKRALSSYDPDLILLEIGTNDFAWGGTDVQGALKNYDTLLTVITTAKPNLSLLIAPILPISGKSAYVTPFNAGVKKKVDSLAALGKKVTWVSEMSAITQSQIAGDGIHPYEATYPVISGKWYQAIMRTTDASSVVSRRPAARMIAAGGIDARRALLYTVRGARVSSSSTTGPYVAVQSSGRVTLTIRQCRPKAW